ncbi:MAG: SPFH domain-containing protein [Oscillospiraceae bacterium]|nr:SPFH domain-containing protein [Oscillospiraceae bacterium]
MGLIKAGIGAVGGVLADQWKEFFYCDALPADVLMRKGSKRITSRSSNTKGNDNIISNGSGIAVADGQCMIIVEQGKIVEVCAEPGEFIYDSSTEPSIFAGSLGRSILDTFKAIGKRFAYGGDTGKDQRVYYFNTKEIMGNKFGTASPILFEVTNKRVGFYKTVHIKCNGIYSYFITDPLLFYTKVCANVEDEFTRDEIDGTLKTEFVSHLQTAFGVLAEQELRPAQLPAKVNELRAAMNDALRYEWIESRGITVGKIALNPINLTDEDMKAISQMEDSMSYGSNAAMMAGRMTNATANAMETAAGNSAGAMTGFMGMGMAGNAMGGGFNSAQQLFQMGQQQQAAAAPAADSWKCACGATVTGKFCNECGAKKPEPQAADGWKCACGATVTGKFCTECGAKKPENDGWTCTCGAVNKGKFCAECGAKKPAGIPQYKCDKCGWEPADPTKAPKFCPECGDPFDSGDII